MSFWAFIGILLILGIMFGALYLSKSATDRQEKEQAKRRRAREIRNDLIDIDELINTLMIYDRNPELLESLANKMERQISEALRLTPESDELVSDQQDLKIIQDKVSALYETPEEPEIPSTDRQIFLLKKHFARAIRTLRDLQSHGEMSELELSTHRARLSRNALVLEVNAYRRQGQEAKDKGEISSAANFLKHAKELLVNSETKFADKMDQIKIVSREISSLYVTLPDKDEDKKKGD